MHEAFYVILGWICVYGLLILYEARENQAARIALKKDAELLKSQTRLTYTREEVLKLIVSFYFALVENEIGDYYGLGPEDYPDLPLCKAKEYGISEEDFFLAVQEEIEKFRSDPTK
jgi:hypothetical protein